MNLNFTYEQLWTLVRNHYGTPVNFPDKPFSRSIQLIYLTMPPHPWRTLLPRQPLSLKFFDSFKNITLILDESLQRYLDFLIFPKNPALVLVLAVPAFKHLIEPLGEKRYGLSPNLFWQREHPLVSFLSQDPLRRDGFLKNRYKTTVVPLRNSAAKCGCRIGKSTVRYTWIQVLQ